eukprot:365787-Chlamydomonas_euryale.AAC.9
MRTRDQLRLACHKEQRVTIQHHRKLRLARRLRRRAQRHVTLDGMGFATWAIPLHAAFGGMYRWAPWGTRRHGALGCMGHWAAWGIGLHGAGGHKCCCTMPMLRTASEGARSELGMRMTLTASAPVPPPLPPLPPPSSRARTFITRRAVSSMRTSRPSPTPTTTLSMRPNHAATSAAALAAAWDIAASLSPSCSARQGVGECGGEERRTRMLQACMAC